MPKAKKRKSHASKSFQVIKENTRTKRPAPPGEAQRTQDNVSNSVSDVQESESESDEEE